MSYTTKTWASVAEELLCLDVMSAKVPNRGAFDIQAFLFSYSVARMRFSGLQGSATELMAALGQPDLTRRQLLQAALAHNKEAFSGLLCIDKANVLEVQVFGSELVITFNPSEVFVRREIYFRSIEERKQKEQERKERERKERELRAQRSFSSGAMFLIDDPVLAEKVHNFIKEHQPNPVKLSDVDTVEQAPNWSFRNLAPLGWQGTVVGQHHLPKGALLAGKAVGHKLLLVRDPANRNDPNAVRVYAWDQGWAHVGYLPREEAAAVCHRWRALPDCATAVLAEITEKPHLATGYRDAPRVEWKALCAREYLLPTG